MTTGSANDSIVFAGTLDGLFKSTDGGESWQLSGDFGDVAGVYPSPRYADDQLVLAQGGSGFYRSSDGGQTWIRSGGRSVSDIAWSSETGGNGLPVIYASAGFGCYREACRSEDLGETWTCTDPGGSVGRVILARDFATSQEIYITAAGAVMRSSDRGATWSSISEELAITKVLTLVRSISGQNVLFAGTVAGVWQRQLP